MPRKRENNHTFSKNNPGYWYGRYEYVKEWMQKNSDNEPVELSKAMDLLGIKRSRLYQLSTSKGKLRVRSYNIRKVIK